MDRGSDSYTDPGWKPAVPLMVWGFIPVAGQRRQERLAAAGRLDHLTRLRGLFGTFCAALLLFLVILPIISVDFFSKDPGDSGVAVGAAVLGIGLLCLAAARFIPKPLDCSSPDVLAGTYTARFFLRLGFSEAAALAGFIASFQTGVGWFYVLSLPVAAVGFSWTAPTARNLQQDQAVLHQRGCNLSLLVALRTAKQPPKRDGRK